MSAESDYVAGSDPGVGKQPAAAASSMPTILQSHEGEHHGDFGGTAIPITRSVKVFAFCAAINSCNIGYDVGASTSIGRLIQDDWALSDEQREVFIGALNFFSIFGALCSQYFSDTFGRRQTFVIASVGFIVGLLLQVAAVNYPMLMTGRALVGLGTGVGLAIDPLYISEISPAKHRGELVTWSEIGINVGIVLGFIMGFVVTLTTTGELQWRTLFLLGTILPCLMIYLALKVMPESPRWYTLKFRYDEARSVLRDIYPEGYNVELVIDDIKEALERERLAEETIGWMTILRPTPAFRRMLIVGIGIATAQQLVGIDAIQYYLLDILEETVDSVNGQHMILILLGFIKLACIFIAGKICDYRGRRIFLIISLLGMAAALLLISFTFYGTGKENPNTIFTVMGLALFLAFFSVGMGPMAWLIPSEVFATCIRAKAMSLAAMLNRVAATVMSSSFLTMRNTLSWEGFFLLLAIICLCTLVFVHFLLPETKGRSLEEMSLYFAEVTGDFSVLDAERKLRMEQELQTVVGSPAAAASPAEEGGSGTMT